MEDKEEKQRSLLGYTNGTHLQNLFSRNFYKCWRVSKCKEYAQSISRALVKLSEHTQAKGKFSAHSKGQ